MIKRILTAAVIAGLVTGSIVYTYAWGVWGHSKINRGAILALPKEMGMFFYNHADYITEEAVAPDIRKYTMGDKSEFPRHYIDLEDYKYTTPGAMPRTLEAARAKYGKDSVDKYGTLPWTIQEVTEKLTNAMREKNKAEILFLAANLAHYIGDAHMPLHTSTNHDGQLTGQRGIHALWESQLPEMFGKDYSLYVRNVRYLPDIEKATWNIIDSSHKLVSPLLYNDWKMRKDKPVEMLYKITSTGQPEENKYGQKTHSYEYAHVYHELLQGMVEMQLRAAISATANYWYTAWVNAGKPDLSDLDPKYITDRNRKFYEEDMKYWMKGKVTGYKLKNEY